MHRNARVIKAALGLLGPFTFFVLTGCQGKANFSSPSAAMVLSGTVTAAKQPIMGSSIQLYVVGTDGIGSSSEPLLSKAVQTDSNGYFAISEEPVCPSPSSKVYIASQGGNPGLAQGTSNDAISLMAMLGACSELSSHGSIVVNEVTTVGSVSPVARYMVSMKNVGSSAGDSGFPAALARVSQLVNVDRGTSPGTNVPAGHFVPTSKLNTLANALAACASSAGGRAGDGSACGKLFSLATAQGGESPTDTSAAAMEIARNPTVNVDQIFALTGPATAPFQPALTAAPKDFDLSLANTPDAPSFTPAEGTYPSGQSITISSSDANAVIYYTLDGSTPTTSSSVYSTALVLSQAETVSAIASDGGVSSPVATANYMISQQSLFVSVANVVVGTTANGRISVPDAVSSDVSVSLSSNLPNYVSVGQPTVTIPMGQNYATFQYTGVGYGIAALTASATSYTSYTRGLAGIPSTPVISPAPGSYSSGQSITITGDSGVPLYYTLDGSAPTASSSVYSAPLALTSAETVSVLAIANGRRSSVASAAYTVSGSQLVFSTQPTNTILGSNFSPTVAVSVVDASGKTVSSTAAITLGIASNPGGGSLTGTITASAVNGVASFPGVSLNMSGNGYTLSATSAGIASATSNSFNVTSGALFISIANIPVGTTATGTISLPTSALAPVTVSLSSNLPNYVSVGPSTVTIPQDQSSGTFSYTGNGVGIATLSASASGYTSATRGLAAIPASVVFSPSSGTYASGQMITLSSTSGATIYYTLDGSGPTASSMVYAGPLVLTSAETVRAIAFVSGQHSSVSAATYNISVAQSQLVFSVQPSNIIAGSAFSPVPTVSIVDASGNVTSSTAPVTLSLASNPGSGSLTGTTTVSAVNGVASFPGLSVSAAGTGYTISAASTTATSTVSSSFNVTAPSSLPVYYVSNSGNDSNSGTASSTPWKTIAKVNAAKLKAGTTVYFQCGSVFRESLLVALTGTPSQPLTYTSYGSCNGSNRPIISGADILSDWTAEAQSGFTAYYATEGTSPALVFEDNHRLALVSAKTSLTKATSYYDSTNQRVYVRTREDADPTSHVVEANVRANNVAGTSRSNFVINGLEVDKSSQSAIIFTGPMTNVQIINTVTNWSKADGIRFSANSGQSQSNVLIQGCTASYNGANGVEKGNGGNNFIVDGCTANYNAFDTSWTLAGGLKFVSDGSSVANRITNSGIRNSVAGWTGVNPDTGAQISSSSNSGVGVWCDTCGDGTFLSHNIAHHSTQAGIQLEYSGSVGSRTMSYNIAYNNFYGILHTRQSRNDLITNNTTWNNFQNCRFSGQYPGGETATGMRNNIYQNNLCASQVTINNYGAVFVAEWGTENNTKGEGSGNIYRNNSFGVPTATNGIFATYGVGNNLKTYQALDAAYGSSMNSMQQDPLLTSPATGNFSLKAGSPAIGAGYGGVDIGAIQYTP